MKRWWADVAGFAAGLTVIVVVALWVAQGGVQEVAGGGWGAVAAVGRLAGLVASDLMLLQVLLLARIPWVERAFGQDQLARWHRWVGFTSFHLLVAHIVLITLGYAGPVHDNVLHTFWDLITTYPGMLLALAGAAAIVMVVVTSIKAARRRLRYESWHLLHLYAYLGVGLALPHQLWTGADFLASPIARAYWWTLWATTAAVILIFRVGLPAWRTARHRLEVAEVVAEGPGLTSVYLKGRFLDRLPVRAGQFFQWRFLDGPGWSRAHPYSLSGPPRPDRLRITVKDLGDGSARVATLRPGTRVLVEGPYGRLTGEAYRGGPVTMIACGIGITPLLALLWDLPYRDGEATLVYRARSAQELAFRSEIEWLAARRGLRVVTLLGPRAQDSWLPHGYAESGDLAALRRIVPDARGQHIYICGPDDWSARVRHTAAEAGVAPDRVHVEHFAW
ncbi:ferredoxin reductase family protein [Hamadaea sp. NPDC051192]|uniref:ferredoxin reductase family protein n=1 Tax=Hamadaea sp. NPDC051192 TaxID=3154940 RepID=UPI00343DA56C